MVLLRRGAPSSIVDDAIQAAAERALRRREPFDGLQGWTNWTITVAWHEVQREWRRQARVESGEPPERQYMGDPAVLTEYRLDLEAVARGLSGLRPADRTAALAELNRGADSGALSPSEKMRRYRARRRLAALIASQDGASTPNKLS